jgi:inosine-uridine nucleoside N-ribohydrolase
LKKKPDSFRLEYRDHRGGPMIIFASMFCKIVFCFSLLMQVISLSAQKKVKPIPVIFDSDMGPDYDDVGAITLLHAFADSGYARILAMVASTKYEGVAAVFNVFNSYFNRPGIIIGVPKGKALELKDWQHWTDTLLLKYPHQVKRNDEVPDATEVYRKMLASQPGKTVTIITTGFLTNLSALLQSAPDKYSRLNGKELVSQKVKQLVCMAGKFPSGSEFNVNRDAAASQFVFTNWPTTILLSGFEIGQKIKTGLPLIHEDKIQNSPVKDVFRICIPLDPQDSAGRMSWDETAVLVAIKGYKPWYRIEKGRMLVHEDGSNSWVKKSALHSHLVEVQNPVIVEQLINTIMMHQPVKK